MFLINIRNKPQLFFRGIIGTEVKIMSYSIQIKKKLLHFKQPAGTSRGIYTTRKLWFIIIKDDETGNFGIGECAPLPALSCDDIPQYEEMLYKLTKEFADIGVLDHAALKDYPSIHFAMEMALLHFRAGGLKFWNTPFSRGEEGITINGLIWMGSFDEMYSRIEEKLKDGFHCVKLKIGAIDFEKEIELIRFIRSHFSEKQIELRVDANGAFLTEDALEKLTRLSKFSIHSIEQPIKAGNWQMMAELCQNSPLPIALDEELIGVNDKEKKIELLETIKPQYIILKPSLHGGLYGCEEWIHLAKEREVGFWATSALESNIGLNAIAQWCATISHTLPQGLGTGLLFTDNIDSPLYINHDSLCYNNMESEPDIIKWLQYE